jgi:hypothetical protein
MISSQSRSRFSRNYWYEETGQVRLALDANGNPPAQH